MAIQHRASAWKLGLKVQGSGLRMQGFESQISGLGFQVSGFGFRVSGVGFRVSGFEFRALSFGSRSSGPVGLDVESGEIMGEVEGAEEQVVWHRRREAVCALVLQTRKEVKSTALAAIKERS